MLMGVVVIIMVATMTFHKFNGFPQLRPLASNGSAGYSLGMRTDKLLTIQEFARMGGLARARKHSKRQLRAWGKRGAKFGKLGGRPKKNELTRRSRHGSS